MAKPSVLEEITNDNQWNANKDFFGRLCIVAHAAFLDAGFRPHGGAPVATSRSLIRRYSLPQLGEEQGEPEDGAFVLLLHRQVGRNGHTELKAYHDHHDGRRCLDHRKQLENAAVKGSLSGGLGRVSHELATPGSKGRWVWKLLAHGLCMDLITCACRVKGLPAGPSFASLPDDVKALILARVDRPESIVMVECASKEMRDLVAEHDAKIWEPQARRWMPGNYEAWKDMYDKGLGKFSWKKWYVEARSEASVEEESDESLLMVCRRRYRRIVRPFDQYPYQTPTREGEEENLGGIIEDIEVKEGGYTGNKSWVMVRRRWLGSSVPSTEWSSWHRVQAAHYSPSSMSMKRLK